MATAGAPRDGAGGTTRRNAQIIQSLTRIFTVLRRLMRDTN